MTKEEYIASGLLELYVAGALSEKENREIYQAMQKFPEVKKEVEAIELAIQKLMTNIAPESSTAFSSIIKKLGEDNAFKIVSTNKPKIHWFKYAGWAAALVIGAGLLWTINTTNQLKHKIQTVTIKQSILESEIEAARNNLKEANDFIEVLRDRNVISVPLKGQAVSPNAYAKVYWNRNNNTVYLDAKGLPEPPEGKVYQFWSLTLNPLTPTDMGIIENFSEDTDKIFKIVNPNQSEAFGITLEPEGGSSGPTLDQLYTLGVIDTAS